MGLTYQSIQSNALTDMYHIEKEEGQYIIALAGNPNTGKSTVFNALTGLHQHTGNWPGKTVVNAKGDFTYKGKVNILVDLPGTYSLFASSVEEEVARDFICFGNSDAVIVVADATCLERNINLLYQVMELTSKVILCINLIDEAKKKNIILDGKGIEKELGIPVVLCAARAGMGIHELKETVHKVLTGQVTPSPNVVRYDDSIEESISSMEPIIKDHIPGINSRWLALRLIDGDINIKETIKDMVPPSIMDGLMQHVRALYLSLDENMNKNDIIATNDAKKSMDVNDIDNNTFSDISIDNTHTIRDHISEQIYKKAEYIRDHYVKVDTSKLDRDRIIDNYITSKRFGIPLMLLTLAIVLWITIVGANIPSSYIAGGLFFIEDKLTLWFVHINAPEWLHGVLILGLYRTLAWVISVMLPPMAIFFPLFTILEDLGYLPRVAFNMDHLFKKACAHGKQCLTMCMVYHKLYKLIH